MDPAFQDEPLPTFVGGFRSGSTLLINLLGLHPKLTPWFETKCICEALRWMRVLENPDLEAFESRFVPAPMPEGFTTDAVHDAMLWHMRYTAGRMSGELASGKADHERYPIGTDYVLYGLREGEQALNRWRDRVKPDPSLPTVANATGRLIRELGDRQVGLAQGTCWINKTPEIPRFGRELRRSVGPCRIIHLIRDGREVALSGAQLGWATVPEMAEWWKGMIELTREAATEAPEDYLEVRFESLIDAPVATLDQILAFLERPAQAKGLWSEYQSSLGTKRNREPQPPARKLADHEEQAFDRIAGGLLRELGYK